MIEKNTPTDPVSCAITVAGGPLQLSKKLFELTGKDCPPANIGMWKFRNSIPPVWVIPVEEISGISRHELRPDIYPVEK